MVAAAAALLAVAVGVGLVDASSGRDAAARVTAAAVDEPSPRPSVTASEEVTAPAEAATAPAGDEPSAPADSSGARSSAGPAGVATAAPDRPDERGLHLSVPGLGMRTEVLALSPSGGVIDPPRFDVAYVIAPYGRPGSDNTTYIAGHSWARGDAVFNPLLDVPSQQAVLVAGDTVDVTHDGTTYTYRVTDSRRYPKGSLADADQVWARVPGRLVLITCFQRDDGGASRDNLVVTAELVQQT